MRENLTELELVVLGIVATNPSCTAYFVRNEIEVSPSSFWSSSSGSVYPLMRRLTRARLIAETRSKWGRRGRALFRVTKAGRAALSSWLVPPLAEWAVMFTVDPIRTRVFFLNLLPAKKRRSFVRDALERTTQAAKTQKKAVALLRKNPSDRAEYLGKLGALRQLEARVRWLREVRSVLELSV